MEDVEAYMRTREITLAFAVIGAVAYGCGGGSSSGTDGGGGGEKDVTVQTDSTTDSGGKDVMVTPEEAGEEASMMDGPAGEGGACKAVKKTDCLSCCEKAHPKGHHELVTAQLTCACTPELCGPLEGGKGFDSGALGEGSCNRSCGTTTAPDRDCIKCLGTATGTKKDPASCYTSVEATCMKDPECVTYKDCLNGCGG
jgi:hypothetical protein